MALPQYSGPDDALAVVRYLKTKSTGSTLKDMTAALGATTTDSRKIAALEYWGIIERGGDKLKLTNPLGRDLARDGSAGLASAMRTVLESVRAYRMALEWAHHQGFSEIDVKELGAYWHDHHSSDLGTESEKAITGCLFDIHAAGRRRWVGDVCRRT